jgi:hypothetical protein
VVSRCQVLRRQRSSGPVDRHRLLVYLAHELQWGLDHGDQRYAVLNACRAAAYAEIGLLLSKVSGGRWWVEHHGPDAPVEKALQAHLAGHDLGPGGVGTRRFVHHVVHRLGECQILCGRVGVTSTAWGRGAWRITHDF